MGVVPVLSPPETRWECPSCSYTDVTHVAGPHSRFHPCRGQGGLTVPMVPAGTRAAHRLNVREDYEGQEQGLRHDDRGRSIMSVQTLRDDGEDCTVYAPTATNRGVDTT